jgi:ribose/xylose/arabinose/galactoside ABC-type transport system permease subunit
MNQNSVSSKNFGARITSLMKKNVPFLILLSLLILFTFIAPNFMTFGNLRTLIRQVSFSGIAAVGLMFVMISGGIDLSIGSQVVLTNVLLAIMMVYGKMDPAVAIPLILGVGLILGAINGLLSITLRYILSLLPLALPQFIKALATSSMLPEISWGSPILSAGLARDMSGESRSLSSYG